MLIMVSACMANVCVADSLKIINWNVLYGFNHHKSTEEAGRWINTQEPEVIAFQELNGISEERLGARLRRHAQERGVPRGSYLEKTH